MLRARQLCHRIICSAATYTYYTYNSQGGVWVEVVSKRHLFLDKYEGLAAFLVVIVVVYFRSPFTVLLLTALQARIKPREGRGLALASVSELLL